MSIRLLVTTDLSPESERAFVVAREQAERAGRDKTKLTLLCVLEDVIKTNVQFGFGFALIDHEGVYERAFRDATAKLQSICDDQFKGLTVEPVVIPAAGSVYQSIIDFANNEKADCIIMATHGRTGVAHAVIGSIAERVVRHAPCPVLIVPIKK